MKRTYKAYDSRGRLVISTWAIGSAQIAEEAAYQARLDRCELISVDVSSDDPEESNFTMYPRQQPAKRRKARG